LEVFLKAFKRAALGTFVLMTILAFQNCGKLSVDLDEDTNFLSSTSSYQYLLLGPTTAAANDCVGYILNIYDSSGAALLTIPPTYESENITFPTSLQSVLFEDDNCTTPIAGPYSTDNVPVFGYLKVPANFNEDVFALVSGRPTNKIRVTAF
jgi:hypothetical protein